MEKTDKLFGRLLAGMVGLFWVFVIFKAFDIGYMNGVSWFMVWSPFLFFILVAFIYIIGVWCWVVWFKKPIQRKRSAAELKILNEVDRYHKRKYHNLVKPTRMKDGAAKAFIVAIAVIIAVMIIAAIRPDPNQVAPSSPPPPPPPVKMVELDTSAKDGHELFIYQSIF